MGPAGFSSFFNCRWHLRHRSSITCLFFNLPSFLNSLIPCASWGKNAWHMPQSGTIPWWTQWRKVTSPLPPPGRRITSDPLFSKAAFKPATLTNNAPAMMKKNRIVFNLGPQAERCPFQLESVSFFVGQVRFRDLVMKHRIRPYLVTDHDGQKYDHHHQHDFEGQRA